MRALFKKIAKAVSNLNEAIGKWGFHEVPQLLSEHQDQILNFAATELPYGNVVVPLIQYGSQICNMYSTYNTTLQFIDEKQIFGNPKARKSCQAYTI